MKKLISSLICLLVFGSNVFAQTNPPAKNVTVNTSTFHSCLSSSNTNVQSALNTLDTCSGGGGGGNVGIGSTNAVARYPTNGTSVVGSTILTDDGANVIVNDPGVFSVGPNDNADAIFVNTGDTLGYSGLGIKDTQGQPYYYLTGNDPSGFYSVDYNDFGAGANLIDFAHAGLVRSGTTSDGGLIFDTENANAPIRFGTGGYTLANERMHIGADGNIGIGTGVPSKTLDVNGEIVSPKINSIVVVDGIRYPRTTAGIQAAHDALPSSGGEIFLPSGTYTLDNVINITKSQVTILGTGLSSYVVLGNGINTRMFLVSGTDFRMERIYVDANQTQNSTVNSAVTISDGADRARIIDTTITNASSRCVSVKENTGFLATLNNFSFCGNNVDSSKGAIGLDGSIGARIENNRFINTQGTSVYLASGLTTLRSSEQTIVIGNWFYGNSHDDGSGGGSDVQWSGGKTDDVIISGNHFGGYADTGHGVNAINIGTTTKDLKYSITNNVMDLVTGVGIEIHGGHGIISNNYMTFTGSGSDQNGMYISSTPNETIISNNQVIGSTHSGLSIFSDSGQSASNLIVSGNIIKNTISGPAIKLNSASGTILSNVTISGNYLFDDQGSPTQTYGISLSGSGTYDKVKVLDNYFSGNSTGNINPSLISSWTNSLIRFISTSGNTGIGTTLPIQKLDVLGTVRALFFSGDGSAITNVSANVANPTGTIGLAAVNGSLATAMRSDGTPALSQAITPTWTGIHTFSNATNSALFTGGNVGIGSLTPGKALDVIGTVRATGFTTIGAITATGNITGGNLSGTNTGDQTTVSGNAGTVTVADAGGDTTTWPLVGTSQTGSLSPATDSGLTYNATTHAMTATTFVGALSGNSTTATTLATARAINGVNFDGSAPITVTAAAGTLSGATLASGVTASSLTSVGTLSSLLVSGNIGINSTTPGKNLDVFGTVRANYFIGDGSGLTGLPAGSGTVNSGLINYLAKYPSTGTTVDDSAVIMDDGTNVGVGTVTPIAELHVTQTGAANSFMVEDQALDPSPFYIDASGNIGVGTTTNTTAKMQIFDNTNGSSVPLQLINTSTGGSASTNFYIQNAAASSTGLLLQTIGDQVATVGNSIGDSARVVAGSNLSGGLVFLSDNATTGDMRFYNGGTTTPTMFLTNGANVGIGTVTAAKKFVVGTTGQFTVDTSGNTATSGGHVQSGTTANTFTGTSTFSNATASILTSGGNVGIFTATPGQQLDVTGTVRADYFVGNGTAITGLASLWATQNTTDQSLAGGNVGIGTTFTTTAALNIMNGNVGIGTWKPTVNLQIEGVAPRLTLIDRIGNTGSILNVQNTSNTMSINANTAQIGNTSNASFNLMANNSTRLTITAAGVISVPSTNVGLGTAAPSGKLIVVGNVGIGTIGVGDFYTSTTPPTGGMIIEGNVGIGTFVDYGNKLQLGKNATAVGQLVCFGTNNCLGYCTLAVAATGACSTCTCLTN